MAVFLGLYAIALREVKNVPAKFRKDKGYALRILSLHVTIHLIEW